MKLSVSVTNYSWPVREISQQMAALAKQLDDSAADTLWVPDHLLQADPQSTLDEPMLEAYTTLGFLAATTGRLRLGTMVTAATFRAPTLLIKAVTTLDVLSGGRAWLGVGAGYNAEEARAMGLHLPETVERFERLAELLELARRMWDGDDSPFVGKHLSVERPIASPQPRRRLPVLIGGVGERRTLRLVAEYADACNLFDVPDGGKAITRKLDVLQRHCAEIGRPYQEIERTVTTAFDGDSVESLTDRCSRLHELGIQHVVLITRGRPWTSADCQIVAAAAERLARLG